MSETALTADHLVIIGRGRLLADTTVDDFVRQSGAGTVKVVTPDTVTPDTDALARRLAGPGVDITRTAPETLEVRGTDAHHIGRTAASHAITLYELTPSQVSLEEAFMRLTHDSLEFTTPLEGATA
jgi:ABC-2 type transport system ATP-binding protein